MASCPVIAIGIPEARESLGVMAHERAFHFKGDRSLSGIVFAPFSPWLDREHHPDASFPASDAKAFIAQMLLCVFQQIGTRRKGRLTDRRPDKTPCGNTCRPDPTARISLFLVSHANGENCRVVTCQPAVNRLVSCCKNAL